MFHDKDDSVSNTACFPQVCCCDYITNNTADYFLENSDPNSCLSFKAIIQSTVAESKQMHIFTADMQDLQSLLT